MNTLNSSNLRKLQLLQLNMNEESIKGCLARPARRFCLQIVRVAHSDPDEATVAAAGSSELDPVFEVRDQVPLDVLRVQAASQVTCAAQETYQTAFTSGVVTG
mmetsp:Transcript_33527/g.44182  ORF Transcript_33527/g.44182 Transcript_33527/m.44182 type:complete len:103 (+) Transcript_33527:232-540(+)